MARGRGSLFPVQTVDRGPTGSFENVNESSLPKGGQLGMVVEVDDKLYRLVRHHEGAGVVATADQTAAFWKDRSLWEVTADQSDSDGTQAGSYSGVITHQNYTWVQMGGEDTVDVSAAAAAVGDGFVTGAADGVLTVAGGASLTPHVAVALDTNDPALIRWIVGAML